MRAGTDPGVIQMAAFVRIEELIGTGWKLVDLPGGGVDIEFPDDTAIDLSAEPADLRQLWGLVLLYAVRDRAASVHYHPWRADDALAIVVDNVRYVMVPPPAHLVEHVVATARALLAPRRGWLGRLTGHRQPSMAGSLTLDVWGNRFEWEVVCWSSRGRSDVEFFRINPPPEEKATAGEGM